MTTIDSSSETVTRNKDEKRDSERKTCFLPVDYSAQDRIYKDFIQNISPRGAYIESQAAMNVGTRVWMTFNWMESNFPVKSKATIVHTSKLGFGVKFDAPIILPASA